MGRFVDQVGSRTGPWSFGLTRRLPSNNARSCRHPPQESLRPGSMRFNMENLFFERPILNSPYEYPARHWELDETGQPTQRIIYTRRTISFIAPIPKALDFALCNSETPHKLPTSSVQPMRRNPSHGNRAESSPVDPQPGIRRQKPQKLAPKRTNHGLRVNPLASSILPLPSSSRHELYQNGLKQPEPKPLYLIHPPPSHPLFLDFGL